ncbi:Nif11-like leader peptide family natural product precursor [Roseofilum sp. BLCC_M154]|uniref:Nif11-like leader peptide family natural product n=1 Tax=Roseofilum acuticapitatum BLCC-M154 TaxID=3022444 RepID=A0ABT7AR52_9CYAN|nr:Nif11-like leader peptide family natural product precursor [Roseofilum acuticapitatum]MDJ1168786.1 Nif11-like leader peptide family natural product precursor [Roseofilum acuticapitatum BLCC-M154]
MSVQNALQFIQQFRADKQLKTLLLATCKSPDLESFVNLGSNLGLHFTVAELEQAHKHDWAMRGLLYSQDNWQ